MSELVQVRQRSPWLCYDMVYNLTPSGREHNRCLKILHGFTNKVHVAMYNVTMANRKQLSGPTTTGTFVKGAPRRSSCVAIVCCRLLIASLFTHTRYAVKSSVFRLRPVLSRFYPSNKNTAKQMGVNSLHFQLCQSQMLKQRGGPIRWSTAAKLKPVNWAEFACYWKARAGNGKPEVLVLQFHYLRSVASKGTWIRLSSICIP